MVANQIESTIVSWNSVLGWISNNPSADKRLSLPKKTVLDSIPQESNNWTTTPIIPATPLSCILSQQDQEYLSHSEGVRQSLLRDECTRLQEQATLTLRGRQWPVRKTAEGLAEVCLETRGEYSTLGFHAMTNLRDCQIILINEQKKTVRFMPEDVRNWNSETELFFIQDDMRGVYIPPNSFTNKDLSKWLSDKETENWLIRWPDAEQTLGVDEIKKILIDHNESLTNKQNKDVLRTRAGRAQSVKILASW